jgi:hypothetical protein
MNYKLFTWAKLKALNRRRNIKDGIDPMYRSLQEMERDEQLMAEALAINVSTATFTSRLKEPMKTGLSRWPE